MVEPTVPDSRVQARRAIEALRSGVPNREAVIVLGSAHPHIEEAFRQELSDAREAGTSERAPCGFLVAGNFGTGKSHLLEYLQQLALQERFVVSKIIISKETPLYDPVKVFRAAMHAAIVPGRVGAPLSLIAGELRFDAPSYVDFFKWVQSPTAALNQRFAATSYLYETGRHDGELADRIISFWAGDPIQVGELKKALKEHGQRGAYAIDPLPQRELAYQRVRFVARLILTAGFSGWVLLFDEVDLVARYSLNQRARSYAEIARWTGQARGERHAGLTTVMAITSAYESEILDERNDREAVPGRLRAAGGDANTLLAGQAERGMALIAKALKLTPPSQSVIDETFEKVRSIYHEAHGWAPPPRRADEERLASTRMREYIRRWINEWDLVRLYPSYQPETVVREVELDYSEDREFATPSEGDSESGLELNDA